MVTIVVAIHVVICLTLIIVILLQQGKGAEIGAVFGGSSQTAMGSNSAGNAMTKTTWVMAAVFFATSIFLAYASTRRFTGSIFGSGAASHRVVPAKPMVPLVPSGPAGSAGRAPAGPAPMTAPAAPAAPGHQAKPVAPRPG